MGNWLQQLLTPPATQKRGSAVVKQAKTGGVPTQKQDKTPVPPQSLPNATIIYGIGASMMYVAAASLLLNGRWVACLGVLAAGVALTGFALHLLKHQD